MPFHQFVKEEVLTPIGMQQSEFYFQLPVDSKLLANGYKMKNGTFEIEAFLAMNIEPAGGLCANASDMEKFLQLMLKNGILDTGQFLQKETIIRIENPQTTLATKAGLPFGYGLANSTSWEKNVEFHGHNGGIDGFGSDYRYSREADLGVAISVNSLVSPGPFLNIIYD